MSLLPATATVVGLVVLARVQEGLHALESPEARGRHDTLRATLDWSHELLSEAERVLFRRLAVFAGGWTLEAAEAVENSGDMVDVLGGLIDQSLVVAEEHDEAMRYRLLESVRAPTPMNDWRKAPEI